MEYIIILKTKLFGIIPWNKKIKNVKFHNFPTDFNNTQFLLVVKTDDSRRMYNMQKYNEIVFPRSAFASQNQNSQDNKGEQPKEHKEILEKI